ncbi:hypothetical protein JCM1841_002719 [Sporobolomyces salmonicolor]
MAPATGPVASSSTNTSSDDLAQLSWANVLIRLEASYETGLVSSTLSSFLEAHLAQLQHPADPFKRDPQGKQQLSSGSLTVATRKVDISKQEQTAVLEVADRFDLDEVEAWLAVQSVTKGKKKEDDRLDDDEWFNLTAWVFEERMAVIGTVALLLRTHEDPNHPCFDLASKLLPSILSDSFTSFLLAGVSQRASQTLPKPVRHSRQQYSFWTKQLVQEQKALLEVLFLVYYAPRPADGPELVRLLETIRTTEWGSRQELFGYFDAETIAAVKEVEGLFTILAVEALNLENAMEQDYPIPPPGGEPLEATSVFHPDNLRKVYEAVEALVSSDSVRASPLLLGWAFLLSKVTASLLERGVPDAYHSFAEQSLRVETASSSGSPQPLFQLYAAHALSPSSSLFSTLRSILHSPLFGLPQHQHDLPSPSFSSSDPNAVGYLSVLRGLITSLPLLIRLPFLTPAQLSGLFSVCSSLYSNPSAAGMCANFWRDQALVLGLGLDATVDAEEEMGMALDREAPATGEAEIIELARSRFPVQFGGLVQLVRALCAGVNGVLSGEGNGNEESEALAGKCAQAAFAYLAHLPTLTHVVPSAPSVTPLPYETLSYPDPATGYSFRASRPIGVSRSVVVPVGAMGRLVSPQGGRPVVVAWDTEWSGWRLFGDVLEEYAGLRRAKKVREEDVFAGGAGDVDTLPIEWDSEEEKAQDVTAVLDILRLTLRNDHSLGPMLVKHLSSGAPRGAAPRPDLIEVLFRILERSLNPTTTVPTRLISSLLGLVAALLPSFPGIIWTFLRGSSLLFPSTTSTTSTTSSRHMTSSARASILQSEKLAGHYPISLSLLNLVHALVLEEQVASCVVSPELQRMKHDVLVRALSWVRDDVWPSYSSWRFGALAEKYELAKRMVDVFKLVLEEGELFPSVGKGIFPEPVSIITDAFLNTATVAQLAPLLSTLGAGPDAIVLLRKAHRYTDAQALEDLVDASLGLTLKLLRLRRRVKGTTSSLLEKLCLSPDSAANLSISAPALPPLSGLSASSATSQRRPELLESLSKLITAPLSTHVAVQAARVFALFCIASGEVQARSAGSSLVALLGGSERAEEMCVGLLKVVEDPTASGELQVAVWDLISAIVDSQPGLAILLVTGRHYPFSDLAASTTSKDDKGKSKELTPVEQASQDLAKSLAPPPLRPLPRTAIGVALETVGIWEEAWKERPALLAAVLRFFDFVWQHLHDYGTALDDFRGRAAAWEAFVKVAFEDPGGEPEDDEAVTMYCHRIMAKAHAVRIVTLDIQAALQRPKPEEATSAKAFLEPFRDVRKLTGSLSSAIASSCAPELHRGIYTLIRLSFPELDLDALRNPAPTHPLDEAREFGPEYLYSLPLMRRKLDGFFADPHSVIDHESFIDIVKQTGKLNLNFSLLEAQISDTRAWRQVLEIGLPLVRRDEKAVEAVRGIVSLVAREVAHEQRVGQVMTTIQAERLEILASLVEVLGGVPAVKGKDTLVDLLHDVSAIFASEALEPLESVARRAIPAFHATLFRIAFFVFRQLNAYSSETSAPALSAEQKTKITAATDLILRTMLAATRDLLVLARSTKALEIEQDLTLAVAVVSQILKSPYTPAPALWLAHCHSLDLFRSAFEVFVYMEQLEPSRPLYAQHVLDLCLAIATSSPRAAEQLALEGVMTALTNNALTSAAESGAIPLVSSTDGSRTPQHELWTTMLALVVALVAALGDSTRFVAQDVTGFVRLYGAQIARALSWNAETPVTAAGLEELAATVALMHGVARSSSTSGAGSTSAAVAAVFVDQGLGLLQHLVYALLHPNHLSALIEGLTPEERSWIEKEAGETELAKKPVAGAVTLAVVQLCRDIVGSFTEYSDAWRTLVKDPMEWKTEAAIVLPTATVTSTEKASLGTLFDLVSYCIDTLRSAPTAVPTPTTPSPSSTFPTLPLFSPAIFRTVCSETLEATLLLSATQIGLYGKLGHGPAQGQTGGSFTRTLKELAQEVTDAVDKAITAAEADKAAAREAKDDRQWLLAAVKTRLVSWL